MKMVQLFVITLCVLTAAFFSRPAFAHDMEKMAEHAQTLRQASTELQASNPDLSKKLNEFADKKDKKREEREKHVAEKKEDLAKVRQAADALKGQNDSLSKDLNDIAGRLEKKMEKKEKQDE